MKGLNYDLVRVVYKLGVLGLTFGVELSEGMEALGVGEVTFLIGNMVGSVVTLLAPRCRDAFLDVDLFGVSFDP